MTDRIVKDNIMRKLEQEHDDSLNISLEADFAMLEASDDKNLTPSSRLCSGLVFLAHGFDSGLVGEPAWVKFMQRDIMNRLQTSATAAVIKASLHDDNNIEFELCWDNRHQAHPHNRDNCEYFVRLDWTPIANYLMTRVSTTQLAKALTTYLLSEACDLPTLDNIPIHLIGHSRGASLICALAELLSHQKIRIEHVTTLDPHPLTCDDPQPPGHEPVLDAPVKKHVNIDFMDNYWQNISYPKGQQVEGAYNRLFSALPGGYHLSIHAAFGDHMNVVLAYHATINYTSPLDTGDIILKDQHRQAYFNEEEKNGRMTGFLFSRAVNPELRPRPFTLNHEQISTSNEKRQSLLSDQS